MHLQSEVAGRLQRILAKRRKLALFFAVTWLVGIQAYFYIDLLVERSGTVHATLSTVLDLFR